MANSIMGTSICTAEQMCKYLLSKNPSPKLNGMDPLEFCKLYLEEGEAEGVRGDFAFCQSCHETGHFRYGGQVLQQQNNFAGIGATNNSPIGKGAWFNSQREGVRAQIQHLKAYASFNPLKNSCVDPRFHLVRRGEAPDIEDLAGRWAVPGYPSKYLDYTTAYKAGQTYGQKILKIYDQVRSVVVTAEDKNEPVIGDSVIGNSVIDNSPIKENESQVNKIGFFSSILDLITLILNKSKYQLKNKLVKLSKFNRKK